MRQPKKGVFAGVGAGLAVQSGAISACEQNYYFTDVTGTSAGACNAGLLAMGYSVVERECIVLNSDIPSLLDNYLLSPLSVLDSSKMAFMAGDKLYAFLKRLIPIKFKDTKIPLTIPVTNIDKRCVEVFSTKNTPDMEVALAIRMSLSIPTIFTPVYYNGFHYVDGGLTKNFFIDNYPVNDPDVIGIRIFDDNDFDPVRNIKDLVSASFFTAMLENEKNSKLHNKDAAVYELVTDFGLFDFKNLDRLTLHKLYLDGYSQMSSHLPKN